VTHILLTSLKLYEEFAKLENFEPRFEYKKSKPLTELNSNLKCKVNGKEVCGFSHFKNVCKEMEISFSSRSVDKCILCDEHKNCSTNCDKNCEICNKWNIHIRLVKLVREKSRLDTQIQYQKKCKITNQSKYLVVSADMQKTLQIPKLKKNYFCEKLSVYNMTFAQLGINGESICVLSHEEQINKNSSDIFNHYLKFFFSDLCQNSDNLVIKCDNCCSQQKSWLFLTSLILIVNGPEFRPKSIEIDYYETGHSFQAADSVHSNISTKMKEFDNIYSYNHLISIIKTSRKNLKLELLKYNEMYVFKDLSKKKKPFNLKKLKSIKFIKGSSKLFVKFDFEDNFLEYSILEKKFQSEIDDYIENSISTLIKLEKQSKPVGIKSNKYQNLIRDTTKLNNTYKEFYQNLKISDI
jgi:hypothetical protein